ncbi:hypothetical protein Tco_1403144 [Tanacetum coccineum]
MPGCSWRGHLRGVHIHYCPGVLGGDTCKGYIFITAQVFLKGTPAMGTYGFHYCPGVLGGDTYDGYIGHRFHELRLRNPEGDSLEFYLITGRIYTDQRGTMVLLTISVVDSRRTSATLIPDEVLKLKNLKKDALLKLFKFTYQERYEHVGPEVTSLQDGEMRLCLIDDLKVFKITFSHSSQDKETSSNLKSMITTSNHKLNIEVKRAQD